MEKGKQCFINKRETEGWSLIFRLFCAAGLGLSGYLAMRGLNQLQHIGRRSNRNPCRCHYCLCVFYGHFDCVGGLLLILVLRRCGSAATTVVVTGDLEDTLMRH